MKRRLLLILLLLVGGAIVNVAVAWGCDRLCHLHRSQALPTAGAMLHWWSRNAPPLFQSFPPLQVFDRFTGIGREFCQWPQRPNVLGSQYVVQRIRSGWPLLSMEQSHWTDSESGRTFSIHAMEIAFLGETQDALAVGPIWPGFAINTVFYAVILWLPFAAPFALRKWRRIRLGLCPKCAYDLRNRPSDSSVCPECGSIRKC